MSYGNRNNQFRISIPTVMMVNTDFQYHELFQRSYGVNINQGTLNKLSDCCDVGGVGVGRQLSETAILDIAPDMIGISTMPGKHIEVPNGWSTNRFRFVMLAVEEMGDGDTILHYIQGYTDYAEVSLSNMPDPRTTMHINSITSIMKTEDPGRPGRFITNILGSYNVISANTYAQNDMMHVDQRDTLIRPQDVFDHMIYQTHGLEYGLGNTINGSSAIIPGKAFASTKQNMNPVSHLTRTINASIHGKMVTRMTSDSTAVLAEASTRVQEPTIARNGFITALYDVTNSPVATEFRFEDIDKLDPRCVVDVFMKPRAFENTDFTSRVDRVIGRDEVADNHGIDVTTTTALNALNAISSYMADSMIRQFSFSLSIRGRNITYTPTGAPEFLMQIPDDFQIYLLEQFKYKILNMLAPIVTQNFMFDLDIHFIGDTYMDTIIRCSVNGGRELLLRLPTFADSLYPPIIASAADKTVLLDSYQCVVDNVLSTFEH